MVERVLKPFSFQWHITDVCNLRCAHCYREEQRQDEMPFEEAKRRVVDQVLDAAPRMKALPNLALSGGEPLLYPHLFPLLDYLRDEAGRGRNFSVLLLTNGTLLEPEMVARLADYYPLLSGIQVSLDGGSAEVHDAIRGPGTFYRSLAGLRRVIETTSLYTTISFTFHRGNAADIPQLLNWSQDSGVTCLYLTRLVPIGRGADMADLVMTAQEVRQALTLLHETNERWATERAQGQERPHISEDRTLFHLTDPQEAITRYQNGRGSLGNACAIGVATMTILADGTVLPCRRLPVPIGNLRQQSLLEIWYGSDLLWQFRRRARHVQGKCQECEFLHEYPGLCSGGSACVTYGACGDYHQPDPHCWYVPSSQTGCDCQAWPQTDEAGRPQINTDAH
jgi:radical SAM protein with 4Fe4S-binding SPASM domain